MAVTFSSGATTGTDLALSGDLTVSGTTTTVDSTVTTIVDPIIHLQTASGGGALASDTNKDVGLALQYHTGSAAKQAFLGWDDSASKLTFIADASISSEVVSGSVGTIVATFEGNLTGNVTGDVSGSAGSATGTAAIATAVTASANNTADETVYPTFVGGATGTQGIETDTGLTYNPNSGVLTATAFAGDITGALTGNASGTAASVTAASQGSITTLAALTSLGAAGATTDVAAGDVTMYNAVNDGNPTISVGSSSAERLLITTSYVSGGQLLEYVKFSTVEASSTANRGKYIFDVDGTDILTIDDGGIDIASGKTFAINGSDIATTDTTYTAGDGLTLTGTDFDLDASLTTVTSILQAGLTVGRDAHNLIDFTTDDKLIFRVADANEVELVAGDLTFTGAQTISTTAGALTVSPKEDVVFRVQDEDGTGVYGLYNFGGRNSGAGVASGLTITAAPSSSDDDYLRLVNVGDAHGPITTWQRNKTGGSYNAAYMMGLAESDGLALHLRVNGTAGDFGTGTLTMQWTSAGNINVPNGSVFIGDYENANMTQGLTINQAANDNEILALKSSDVAHGITDILETDTFGKFQKIAGADGGLQIVGVSDSTTNARSVFVQGYSADVTPDTTKSTAGIGILQFESYIKSGTSVTTPGAGSNLFAIRAGGTTAWIAGAGGDTWQSGSMTLGGGQIAFPATQNASADANTLDDYEEGTWTATFSGISISYTANTGRYTKVGNLVTAYVYINIASQTTGAATITILGLPFVNHASGPYASVTFGQLYQFNVATGTPGDVVGNVASGGSTIGLYSSVTDANWVTINGGSIDNTNVGIMLSITYVTNS